VNSVSTDLNSMETDTIVIVCAVMSNIESDARFAYDAVRWLQLAELKGVHTDNLLLYGNFFDNPVFLASKLDLIPKPTSEKFSLTSVEFARLYKAYFKGDESNFLQKLENFDCTKWKRVSIILINHGTLDGLFGMKILPLDPVTLPDVEKAYTKIFV